MALFTTIYTVRHGETVANADGTIQGQSDTKLSELGLKQAQLVAARLKNMHFDAIYSSDLSRAMTTAQAIADGRSVIPAKELREWNLGDWQGHLRIEVEKRYAESWHAFRFDAEDFRVPGGESKSEILRRIGNFTDMVAKKHLGQQILLVSHGGALRTLFRHALGISGMLPCQPRTDNTGVSCYRYFEAGYYQLILWNDVSHLGKEFTPCVW